jgi:tryptophan synthase alpha chain
MNLHILFPVEKHEEAHIIPVILMGYMNPVLQYGFERFCADAADVGVDGLILPDLPEYEFEKEYGELTLEERQWIQHRLEAESL